MLNNIKTSKASGFTIVELLIVIVVIAILAAITIVAYNGIQTRAKTNSGQQTANAIVKKYEAINAVKGQYIDTAGGKAGAAINTYANSTPSPVGEAVVDNPSSVLAATGTGTSGLDDTKASNGTVVASYACSAGANVWYWDFTNSAQAVMKAGAGC